MICAQIAREQEIWRLARRVCYCELFKRVGLTESGTGSCEKAVQEVAALASVFTAARFECLAARGA